VEFLIGIYGHTKLLTFLNIYIIFRYSCGKTKFPKGFLELPVQYNNFEYKNYRWEKENVDSLCTNNYGKNV
jgi:hypothetical protein